MGGTNLRLANHFFGGMDMGGEVNELAEIKE